MSRHLWSQSACRLTCPLSSKLGGLVTSGLFLVLPSWSRLVNRIFWYPEWTISTPWTHVHCTPPPSDWLTTSLLCTGKIALTKWLQPKYDCQSTEFVHLKVSTLCTYPYFSAFTQNEKAYDVYSGDGKHEINHVLWRWFSQMSSVKNPLSNIQRNEAQRTSCSTLWQKMI